MPWKTIVVTSVCCIGEVLLWVLFFSIFVQVIGPLSDEPLALLPLIGVAFDAIDSNMTVADLLSAILAFVSIVVPIFIWSEILKQQIYKNPKGWFADPINRVCGIAAGIVFLLVFSMEAACLYMLIAGHKVPGILNTGDPNAMLEYLSANMALGILVSVGLAVLNTVIALITVKSVRDLNDNM